MKINTTIKTTALSLFLISASAPITTQAMDGNTIATAAAVITMQNQKYDLLFLEKAVKNLEIFVRKGSKASFKKIISEKNAFQYRTPLGKEFKSFLDIAINEFIKNIKPLIGVNIVLKKPFVEKTIFDAFDILEEQFIELIKKIKTMNSPAYIITALEKMLKSMAVVKAKLSLIQKLKLARTISKNITL
ncbi:hypothetical protein KAH94_06345 [bacterium]|nr:hypothetical protein [bacterium]